MSTRIRRSAKRGAKAQKRYESVKGFCLNVSLRIKEEGINSEDFEDVYIGYLADICDLKKAEGESAASLDKRADDLAAAKFDKLINSEEGRAELENSKVFETMKDKEKMYQIFRASLPCFTEGGKFSFAKAKCIAYRVSDLSAEEVKEFESKSTFEKSVVNIEGKEVTYFCNILYSASLEESIKETYQSRRAFLKEEKEQTKAYFKNEGRYIYTLVAIDKGDFKYFSSSLSASLQEANAAIIRRRAEEAEAARRAEAAAAKAAAFLNQEAAAKLADFAAVAVAVAVAKEANKYGKKTKDAVNKKAEGLNTAIKNNGEAAKAYFENLADAKEAAAAEIRADIEYKIENIPTANALSNFSLAESLKEEANELKKVLNKAESDAAAAAADAVICRKYLAAAALIYQRIKEEAAAIDLRRAAAPYLQGDAAAENSAAIERLKEAAAESDAAESDAKEAAAVADESAKPKAKGKAKGKGKSKGKSKAAAESDAKEAAAA